MLPAGALGGKAALEQFNQQQLGMIPLDFDIPRLDRSAAAAAALEFAGQSCQRRLSQREAGDHRHRLAAVPFAFAAYPHLAVADRSRNFFALAAGSRLAATGAETTMFRREDRAGVGVRHGWPFRLDGGRDSFLLPAFRSGPRLGGFVFTIF